MRQLPCAIRFTGRATPASDNSNTFMAVTPSPSTRTTSTFDDTGLDSTIESTEGKNATFTSQVEFSSERAFTETASITCGVGNRLDFSTAR